MGTRSSFPWGKAAGP